MKEWSKFTCTTKDGKKVNLVIKEWPSDNIDQVIDFHIKYYVSEDILHKAAGIFDNKQAVDEYRKLMPTMMDPNKSVILVCTLEDDKDSKNIIGLSMMEVIGKDDDLPNVKIQTKEMELYKNIIYTLAIVYDPTKSLSVDKYYADMGFSVIPDYMDVGVIKEMIRINRAVCKEHNLPFVGAWIADLYGQTEAEKDGWQTVHEISSEELGKKCGVAFKNAAPTFKFMITRV